MKQEAACSRNPYRHLFGPVPSRRLGLSLGVDLLPLKTCSFDCVFCQLGRTRVKTRERREYVPTGEVIEEIRRWIDSGGRADYITLSGSGEPTLHTGFGEIVRFVRSATSIHVALLTNGSLLEDPSVRGAASSAHLVKVSLSVWNDFSYTLLNRPEPTLHFEGLLSGLKDFRRGFRGVFWIEVFIVWGVNSVPGDVARIARLAKALRPDCVHLNTAVRPPAMEFVKPLPPGRLERLTGLFEPPALVAADYNPDAAPRIRADEQSIFAMLARRPSTPDQIASAFGMHRNEVSKVLGKLHGTGRIRMFSSAGGVYFQANEEKDQEGKKE